MYKSPLSRNKLFVGSGFQDMDIFAACSSGFCPTARIPSQSNSELGKSEFFPLHPPKALIEPSLCAGNSLNVWNRNRNADTTKKKKKAEGEGGDVASGEHSPCIATLHAFSNAKGIPL